MSLPEIHSNYIECLKWAEDVKPENGDGAPSALQVGAQLTEMKTRQQKCLTYLLYEYSGDEDFVKKRGSDAGWPQDA